MNSAPGIIEIVYKGQPLQLVPTYKACIEISKAFGGISAAVDRLSALQVDAYVQLVKIALNAEAAAGQDRPTPGVGAAVFEAGILNLRGPLTDYLALLGMGGRVSEPAPLTETGEAGEPEMEEPPKVKKARKSPAAS